MSAVVRENPRAAFAAWSEVYDQQPNPLLALEGRYLAELLSDVRGLDIVDVGCGTGRWLTWLAGRGARSLTGIDSSPEMAARAKEKLGASANILVGDMAALPLSSHSADLLLVSFVASYVQDLREFAAELKRVAREGTRVYVTDLHPVTTAACNWKRGFRTSGAQVEIATHARSIGEMISTFEDCGFQAELLLEPPFGNPERETLRRAGKLSTFYEAEGRPAIYILQLSCGKHRNRREIGHQKAESEITLTDACVALGAEESVRTDVVVTNEKISSVGLSRHRRPGHQRWLDLDGYLLLPGLINAHDHLEFALYPNLGHGPYTSFERWAADIHQTDADIIRRQRRIPKNVRLWWGAIRNLLCGVTTVCHHNPLDSVLLGDNFPVRVLTKFGWAHSVAMDPDLVRKFDTTPKNLPFILHAGEGLDEKSAGEIFELDRLNILEERTVLVHGLALTPDGIALLNRRGAALVWCPTSNEFLFGRTHSREALSTVANLLLGSDSPLTAAGDLLDEVHYAHDRVAVSAEDIYRMVLTRPAATFRFDDGRSAIRIGAAADLIAVSDIGVSPAKRLAQMSSSDVELVIVGGRVQLASDELCRRLPQDLTSGLEPLEVDDRLVWIRAPLERLFAEVQKVLQCNVTLGQKKVRHARPR